MNESQVPHAEEKKHGKKKFELQLYPYVIKIASQFLLIKIKAYFLL